ncbi:MAG: hypothetical protein JWP27_3067 [Flaviaesturariibacter sp.]|nr:hypothetical protein [Flaviaesturariibacter sp.]
MTALEIVGVQKGDSQVHLAYGEGSAETVCGRTLRENRWCTLHWTSHDDVVRMCLGLIERGRTWFGGPCVPCAKRLGLDF